MPRADSRKDPETGKDWRQEKGMTEDEMIGGHHGFNGHEFEQISGDSEGQGGMGFFSPLGLKEWATKEQQQQSFKHLFKVVKCQHQ